MSNRPTVSNGFHDSIGLAKHSSSWLYSDILEGWNYVVAFKANFGLITSILHTHSSHWHIAVFNKTAKSRLISSETSFNTLVLMESTPGNSLHFRTFSIFITFSPQKTISCVYLSLPSRNKVQDTGKDCYNTTEKKKLLRIFAAIRLSVTLSPCLFSYRGANLVFNIHLRMGISVWVYVRLPHNTT